MSKIFRLGEGSNTYTDWNESPSFPYNSNNRKKIQDPDGATAKKEITSIPSPFARMQLVKDAFREIVKTGDEALETLKEEPVEQVEQVSVWR